MPKQFENGLWKRKLTIKKNFSAINNSANKNKSTFMVIKLARNGNKPNLHTTPFYFQKKNTLDKYIYIKKGMRLALLN